MKPITSLRTTLIFLKGDLDAHVDQIDTFRNNILRYKGDPARSGHLDELYRRADRIIRTIDEKKRALERSTYRS